MFQRDALVNQVKSTVGFTWLFMGAGKVKRASERHMLFKQDIFTGLPQTILLPSSHRWEKQPLQPVLKSAGTPGAQKAQF